MPRLSLGSVLVAVGLLIGWSGLALGQQPLPPEQQAEQALNAARKIYTDGDLPLAQQQFQQIIQKFGNTPQANAARFGLALCFLNAAKPDYPKAIENLTGPANDGNFSDRYNACYQLAAAQRMLGVLELEKKAANPGEVNARQQAANQRFIEARRWYDIARTVAVQKKDDDNAGRSRCDMAEMDLRLNRFQDARATCEPFLKDSTQFKNKSRPLGLYYHGLASFLLKDYSAAGRSLNQLSPFTDPAFGLHAEYLAGRVLQLNQENAEASVHYDTVLANFAKQKAAAIEALKQPDRFRNNPLEKARLESLASGPVPDYVAGAAFHGASLNYEAGQFNEAIAKYQAFLKDHPGSPLLPDATLRVGFCQVQLKQLDEAIKTLQPLAEQTPRLADQATFWLGKAQLAIAQNTDPGNPQERETKLKGAITTLKAATDKANQRIQQNETEARPRRHEMLFDLADAMQLNKQYREAAQIYEQLWNEQALPRRREEILQRLATSTGTGGEWDRSNQRCEEFRRTYPQSVLLPSVLYQLAENSLARAIPASKDRNRAAEWKAQFEEAASKFKDVVEKFPEFERLNHARFSLGVCYTQLDKLDEAVAAFEGIAAAERTGDLALANYLQAEVLIRQEPRLAADAGQAKLIRERLTRAAGQLESFVSARPKDQRAAAALLKLGYCTKRLADGLANPTERNQKLNSAREIYERLARDNKADPLAGEGVLELARVKALLGDIGGAQNDLRQFSQNAELAKLPVAPLAAVHLATLYRQQNNPTEAANVLAEARKRYEPDLLKDPQRASWADLMKFHHAVALFEQNKPKESRPLFEQVTQAGNRSPMIAAEAVLRLGQSQISEARQLIDQGTEARNQAGTNQQKRQQAEQQIRQGRQSIHQAAEMLMRAGDQNKTVLAEAEPRARMSYDAAWAWRYLADEEVRQAGEELRKQLRQQAYEALVKKLPEGQQPPAIDSMPVPPVERTQIPPQPSEQRAIAAYRKQVEEFADSALSVDARHELAELLTDRNQHDEIITLLKAALEIQVVDREVPTDTLERVRLRLGSSLSVKKQFPAAAMQFEAVARNPKSPYLAQALYRAGEAYLAAGNHQNAIEKLSVFRDQAEFQNRDGISDRAMLRLGQALTATGQFDPARQALETLLQRFGQQNPHAVEARYGLAIILRQQNRLEEAIQSFQQVMAASTGEVAARSASQVAQCLLAQRKFSEAASQFLLVAYTYDQFPEIGYAAVLEAARAYTEDNKPDLAEKVLRKLLKQAPPNSDWAKAAQERLEKLKK